MQLPKFLTKITMFSKILIGILLIVILFVSFFLRKQLQDNGKKTASQPIPILSREALNEAVKKKLIDQKINILPGYGEYGLGDDLKTYKNWVFFTIQSWPLVSPKGAHIVVPDIIEGIAKMKNDGSFELALGCSANFATLVSNSPDELLVEDSKRILISVSNTCINSKSESGVK